MSSKVIDLLMSIATSAICNTFNYTGRRSIIQAPGQGTVNYMLINGSAGPMVSGNLKWEITLTGMEDLDEKGEPVGVGRKDCWYAIAVCKYDTSHPSRTPQLSFNELPIQPTPGTVGVRSIDMITGPDAPDIFKASSGYLKGFQWSRRIDGGFKNGSQPGPLSITRAEEILVVSVRCRSNLVTAASSTGTGAGGEVEGGGLVDEEIEDEESGVVTDGTASVVPNLIVEVFYSYDVMDSPKTFPLENSQQARIDTGRR